VKAGTEEVNFADNPLDKRKGKDWFIYWSMELKWTHQKKMKIWEWTEGRAKEKEL
jgi:hypothetical protein